MTKENIYQFKIDVNTHRITLPFLDRNNDYTEFYVIKKGHNSFFLTDDGLTLSDLESSGFNIFNSKKRKTILNAIISSYGITLTDDNQLSTYCNIKNIAYKKHMLAQCMFYLNNNIFDIIENLKL